MKNITKKNSKKGFTLIELVIVIAILAILAAIAIPVVTTTIHSAQMSVMESDAATLNMLLKTAVNEMENEVQPTMYNSKVVSPSTNVNDVMIENNISDIEFTRKIGGVDYYLVWNKKGVEVSQVSTQLLSNSTTLATLSKT